MDAYKELAQSYDRLTNDVDYASVVDFYFQILQKEGLQPRTAVDLACGTGSVALLLVKRGLCVTGVDMSEDMLTVAWEKAAELDPADCAEAIRRVYRALNPGGIFIFDVNTPEKLKAMDGQVFLDEDDDVYCVWRGEFDLETNICSYGMDLFQRDGEHWLRSFEEHQEYAYSIAQLTGYLEAAGFDSIRVYADREFIAPREGEQRVYFKARKGRVKCKTTL